MLIERIATVGSYELLYNIFISLFRQLPTIFMMLSTLPLLAQEAIVIAIMLFGMEAIVRIASAVRQIILWLNNKL